MAKLRCWTEFHFLSFFPCFIKVLSSSPERLVKLITPYSPENEKSKVPYYLEMGGQTDGLCACEVGTMIGLESQVRVHSGCRVWFTLGLETKLWTVCGLKNWPLLVSLETYTVLQIHQWGCALQVNVKTFFLNTIIVNVKTNTQNWYFTSKKLTYLCFESSEWNMRKRG